MKRSRGFKLGLKLPSLFKWTLKRKRKLTGELDNHTRSRNPISRICRLARSIQRGAKELCSPRSDYKRLGQNPFEDVPRGHLAVYVGLEDYNNASRIVVPVIYFNHPLFSELLKAAENEHGYNHPGGITIPCRMSEFEKVQNRIASGDYGRRQTWRQRFW